MIPDAISTLRAGSDPRRVRPPHSIPLRADRVASRSPPASIPMTMSFHPDACASPSRCLRLAIPMPSESGRGWNLVPRKGLVALGNLASCSRQRTDLLTETGRVLRCDQRRSPWRPSAFSVEKIGIFHGDWRRGLGRQIQPLAGCAFRLTNRTGIWYNIRNHLPKKVNGPVAQSVRAGDS